MKVKRKDLIDAMIWCLFAFYILIGHWIWHGRGIQETVLLMLMLIAVISNVRVSPKRNNGITILVLLLIEMIATTAAGESHDYLMEDLKAMIGGLLCLLYIYTLHETKIQNVYRCILKYKKYLFAYAWINTFIILLQAFKPGFFVNRSAVESVGSFVTHFDQMTGLIGVNGTTRWNLFSCLIIVLYFVSNNNKKGSRKYKKEIAKTVLFTGISLIISLFNSTRAFIITCPMVILIYYYGVRKVNLNKKVRYTLYGVGIVLFIFAIIYAVPFFRSEVIDLYNDKIAKYLTGDLQYLVATNDDRGIAVDYAIRNGGNFGKGIGFVPMNLSNYVIKFLGLNSASSYIMLIGIIGYILTTLTWAFYSVKIVYGKTTIRRVIISFMIFLVLSYLLPVYSYFALPMLLGLICLLLSINVKGERIIQ